MSRILIAGCGYVGTALALELAAAGHEVWGLRRDPTGLPASIRPCRADLRDRASLQRVPDDCDSVFYTAAAGGRDEAAYRAAYLEGVANLFEVLGGRASSPRRVFFTSSTAVYAQEAGEWVDEASTTEPWHFSGRVLVEAERAFSRFGLPAVVVRLGGIYGPGRTSLVDRVREGRARYAQNPPRYTNRIHRDDCAGLLAYLYGLAEPQSLYVGVDCEPASEEVVLRWLAERLGVPAPSPEVEAGAGERPRRGNKRCRNERLLGDGYRFRYPSFREGYGPLIAPR